MDRILTGLGDGCDNCLVQKELWTDLEKIDSGFPNDRTLESLKETYEGLRKNKRGEIVKETGDYEVRQGICGEVLTLRPTTSFTVTHKVKWTKIREIMEVRVMEMNLNSTKKFLIRHEGERKQFCCFKPGFIFSYRYLINSHGNVTAREN